jgi:SAM-dependent methyltransferase
MTAQYDAIADGYRRTKSSPVRTYVEAYSFMRWLGDLSGLRVLDLACGEGHYTRRIRRAGAVAVTGVDVSPAMISAAEARERDMPLGIEYLVADVAEWNPPERLDLVAAAYLLHYAPDVDSLRRMCRTVANALGPGGRFVAINENPDQSADFYPGYTRYGFDKRFVTPRHDGSRIQYTMVAGREMVRFEAFYYCREVYEQALSEAGFRDVRWRPLELDPAGELDCGTGFFADYLANPPAIGLEATR